MKIAQLPIWTHHVQHGVALGLQISRQARTVGAGAFDAKGFDTAKSGRSFLQAAIPVTRGRNCHGTVVLSQPCAIASSRACAAVLLSAPTNPSSASHAARHLPPALGRVTPFCLSRDLRFVQGIDPVAALGHLVQQLRHEGELCNDKGRCHPVSFPEHDRPRRERESSVRRGIIAASRLQVYFRMPPGIVGICR